MLQQAVSEYGYSLIELLIVLVMMAVILSIVVLQAYSDPGGS
jgi:prepilin-type N-terminal cleavage/methylation domain-containing protein